MKNQMQQLGRVLTRAKYTQHNPVTKAWEGPAEDIWRAEGILGVINRCWGIWPHFR